MILLTGATGFLGAELLARLKGRRFRCLTRSPEAVARLKKYGCEVVLGDITEKVSVGKAAREVGVVIHAAALIKADSISDYRSVNVEGTRNLVEAAKKAKVRNFIFLSSIVAAYERTTDYGKSKLEAEEVVKNSGLPFTILRISVMYGKNDTKTLGSLVRIIKKSPVIPLIGFGNSPLQPVYAGDVASAILNAANKRPSCKTYYLAGPVVKYRDMVGAIASALELKRILLPVPPFILKLLLFASSTFLHQKSFSVNQLNFLSSGKVFSFEDASRDLGFSPLGFSEGLDKLLGVKRQSRA